ncbi:MAG: hypothetical protein A2X49_05260 [Lentisphaerae bacterium GWF2_52_8]|nr:MAG: hypothetical protein A2X49_05260 [Lentisphaerae bacterium GWF2_52_8]
MKRRSFLKLAGIAALILGTGLKSLAEFLPERVRRAMMPQGYPGPLKKLDHDKISKPGPWAG